MDVPGMVLSDVERVVDDFGLSKGAAFMVVLFNPITGEPFYYHFDHMTVMCGDDERVVVLFTPRVNGMTLEELSSELGAPKLT